MPPVSKTLACQELLAQRQKQNLKVYNFGLGANPLPQPQQFIDAVNKYSSNKQYTTPKGIPQLNETIKKMWTTSKYQVENVIFGNGLKELLYVAQMSFKGTIIHITPSWVGYKEQIKALDKLDKLVEIETLLENEFKVTPQQLEDCFSQHSESKMLIFNNPDNPTGVMYTPNEVKQIAKICQKYNVMVLTDEIYMNINHFNEFQTIADFIPHLTIRGSSVSKDLACGGYRLGWITFPKELNDFHDLNLMNAVVIYSCTCTPIQYATNEILNQTEVLKEYFDYQNKTFKEIIKQCFDIIKESKIGYVYPTSAWYTFLDFNEYESQLQKININTSDDLSMYLLNEIGIVTVPGDCFHVDGINLRFSFVDTIENMLEGLKKMIDFLNNLN